MRTTVTLEPDVVALLKRMMKRKGMSFKAALNQALRTGLSMPSPKRSRTYRLPTFRMGYRPESALDKALSIAAALEDEEIARKLSLRK